MEQTECGTGIKEVSESNPGIWVDHSGYVAEACKILRSSAMVCLLKKLICFCKFCCLLQLSVSIYIKMDKKV